MSVVTLRQTYESAGRGFDIGRPRAARLHDRVDARPLPDFTRYSSKNRRRDVTESRLVSSS